MSGQIQARTDLTILIPQNDPVDVAFDGPELYGRVRPLSTALWSCLSPVAKECRSGWSSASTAAIQAVQAVAVQPGKDLGEFGDVPGQGV